MKKITIIGGGIIGMTLAVYLDHTQYEVTVIDQLTGQATSASAGIISPWLSKRRNKKWYRLAQDGAAFFERLVQDFGLDQKIYAPSGTLIVQPEAQLLALAELAALRKETAPEIGEIKLLTSLETKQALPLLKPQPSLSISGGGRLDGRGYLLRLKTIAQKKKVKFIEGTAVIQQQSDTWHVKVNEQSIFSDILCVTAGPGIQQLLAPLGYQVDVRPQKGQLLSFATPFRTDDWPVAMLAGEGDLIPFADGTILLGATHENNAKWDLTPTEEAKLQLTAGISGFLQDPDSLFSMPLSYRVGTRAYTADFAPFFGDLTDQGSLFAASGLGSSGLTTGPYIGFLLAQAINSNTHHATDFSQYSKPMTNYITPSMDLT
ncbi:FAD-dependent oxidoreductase [Enterococcus sp.]|uniref:NAD(P)/FAD-dependent oxidoreductase n=1 Tax=Enterococcus sp. TaxID=35783 RepID=UPI00289BAC04|nr:FAD-dependent oxidoreductase [Enterococcus sp.]